MFSKKNSSSNSSASPNTSSPSSQKGISRRKALVFTGSLGGLTLSGCKTMPTQADFTGGLEKALGISLPSNEPTLIPKQHPFARKGNTAHAQSVAIFRQFDAGVPITPHPEEPRLSEPLIAAVKEYERVKKQLQETLALRQKTDKSATQLTYEESTQVLAPAMAQVVRIILEESAQKDKALEAPVTPPSRGTPKITYQNNTFRIPPQSALSFVQKGYCMDPSLPAPSKDDAYEVWHVSERVPQKLIPLYQAVGRWAAKPENKGSAQSITWAIMGAGTESGWAKNVSQKALQQMNEAMPGGAQLFLQYHKEQMLANAIAKIIIKKAGLEPYIDPRALQDNYARDRVAQQHMQDLIAQGQSIQGIKGSGYNMLAPNVAVRASGANTLSPRIQVINATQEPFDYEVLEWFAQPVYPKQGASTTLDISDTMAAPAPVAGQSAQTDPEAHKFLSDFLKDASKFGLETLPDHFSKHTLGAANAVSKGVRYAIRNAGLTKDARRTLIQGAASLISATPVVGNLLSGYEFLSGRDWFTGEPLTKMERAGALLGTIPGAQALKAVAKGWKLGAGSKAALNNLSEQKIFSFADKSENYQNLNNFIWSDTANNISDAVSPDSSISKVLNWNASTKETASLVMSQSYSALPWQKSVSDYFKKFSATGQILPGL